MAGAGIPPVTDGESKQKERCMPCVETACSYTREYNYQKSSWVICGETYDSVEISLKIDISHLDRDSARYIKVARIDPSTSGKRVTGFYFQTYMEQQDVNINYDGRAYVDISFNSREVNNQFPSRIYEVDGLIIKVPSNYNPRAKTYHGIWDGTFKNEWTNNPVWILYDLLTNGRYGLGRDVLPENINTMALYKTAQYCDEYIDDGFGGTEPRYTYNGVINSQARAYEVLQMVASAFNGLLYSGGGAIFVMPDRVEMPIKTFGRANVINGTFTYESTSSKLRHTSIRVTWINPKTVYQPEVEVFDDVEGIEKYGLNILEITAHGCTSRGQAQRMARYALFTELYETDTVTFDVGIANNDLRPNDYIYIADEMIQKTRLLGKLKAIDKFSITLDYPIKRSSMFTQPKVLLTSTRGVAKVYDIETGDDTTDYIKFKPEITKEQAEEFSEGDVWCIYDPQAITPRKFRVLSVRENKDLTFSVTALSHFDDKFKYVEQGVKFEEQPPISIAPTGIIQPPEKCQIKPYLVKIDGIQQIGAKVSWSASADSRVKYTEVTFINQDGSFGETIQVPGSQTQKSGVPIGRIGVMLQFIGDKGEKSEERTFYKEIGDPYSIPPKPEKLAMEAFNGAFNAKWVKPVYSFDLTYEYYIQSNEETVETQITPNTSMAYNKKFMEYPQKVFFYVRSVGPSGKTSEFAVADCIVDLVSDDDPLKFLESIDRTWLTDDLQQEIGMFDTLNSIGETILKQTARIDKVWTATQTALAFAVEGINAEIKDNKEATAEKFSQIRALYGEQMKCDKPNPADCAADFGLKWYDGSDPKYPLATNPVYNKDLPKSVTNFPYLPVMPSTSLIGQIQRVRSSDKEATAEEFKKVGSQIIDNNNTIKAEFTEEIRTTAKKIEDVDKKADNTISEVNTIKTWKAENAGKVAALQENALVSVDGKGNTIADYSIKLKETSADGKTVKAFGGFGLTKDGVGTTFGINADTFFIAKPGQSAVSTTKESDTYIMAVTQQNTYIGTRDTWFKGNMQSSNFVKGASGWQINSNGKSIFSEVEIYSTSADTNNPTMLTLKNGTIIQSFTQAQKKSPE